VAFGLRSHVEKRKVVLRFSDFVAGDFSVDDAGENAGHGVVSYQLLVIGYQGGKGAFQPIPGTSRWNAGHL
jgi:hypothetical protein